MESDHIPLLLKTLLCFPFIFRIKPNWLPVVLTWPDSHLSFLQSCPKFNSTPNFYLFFEHIQLLPALGHFWFSPNNLSRIILAQSWSLLILQVLTQRSPPQMGSLKTCIKKHLPQSFVIFYHLRYRSHWFVMFVTCLFQQQVGPIRVGILSFLFTTVFLILRLSNAW